MPADSLMAAFCSGTSRHGVGQKMPAVEGSLETSKTEEGVKDQEPSDLRRKGPYRDLRDICWKLSK